MAPAMVCPRCSLRNPPGTVSCARCGEATPVPVARAISTVPPPDPRTANARRGPGLSSLGSFAPPVRAPVRARPRTVREHPAARMAPRTPRIAAAPAQVEPPPRIDPLPSAIHHARTDPLWTEAPPVRLPPPVSVVEKPHARLAPRAAAALIDTAIVLATVLVGWILAAIAYGPFALAAHFSQGFDAALDALVFRRPVGALTLAFALVTAGTYLVFSHVLAGATFGQRRMHLALELPDGRRPTLGEATVRVLAALLLSIPGALTFAAAVVDPARRTLHDRLVGSRVVERRPADEEDAEALLDD